MVEGKDFAGQKGSSGSNPADGVLHKFDDEMLDPHAMWTREVAGQLAKRIAQDVQQHDGDSDKDLIKIARSLNQRGDVTATSNVNQALGDLGFPQIMVGTMENEAVGGRQTEITAKSNGVVNRYEDRWFDTKHDDGPEVSGHDVTQTKRPVIMR